MAEDIYITKCQNQKKGKQVHFIHSYVIIFIQMIKDKILFLSIICLSTLMSENLI